MNQEKEFQTFQFQLSDLPQLLNLNRLMSHAVKTASSELFRCELDDQSKDNFGSYASGYRVFLRDASDRELFYIWFGAIYSSRKAPAGIMVEVDRQNNPDRFAQAWDRIEESGLYELSKREAPFIKLFLPGDTYESMLAKSAEEQADVLRTFFIACCEGFVKSVS